ncbi:MAG: hypothetical protein ABSA83_13535 [Verrucomicrobiota bacterium]|jgi:hypothetical protein
MKTNPRGGSDTSSNNEAVKALLRRKPLLERLAPVMGELLLTIKGGKKPSRQEKPLPEYCYNIFKVLRKTYCKILPEPEQLSFGDAKETDWEALGKLIGAGLRCLRFGESDFDAIIKREGLPVEETAQLTEMIRVMPWLSEKRNPWGNGAELVWKTFLATNKSAHERGLGTFARLTGAIEKGIGGFMDEEGQCVGESGRANIYWFLLLVWPEIQEMQRRRPPITRADFNEWLRPFAQCGLVSITDLDQLLDVCDSIALRFKGTGAPRKK